jgi:hypothetical protein
LRDLVRLIQKDERNPVYTNLKDTVETCIGEERTICRAATTCAAIA